jgi:hypothetical protein
MKKLHILCLLNFMLWSQFGLAESAWSQPTQPLNQPLDIVVYRSPTCGCCKKWVAHLQQHQFQVKDIVTDDVKSIKDQYGVPNNLASCHTAIVDGYVIEGHVPAADIKKLISTKPKVTGISVPGMVTGSPGMEMGERKDPFKVITFDDKGDSQIFNEYGKY